MATDKQVRALLSPKVAAALRKATTALKAAKIDHALVGGLAYDHYARDPRFTADVDFVVAVEDHERATAAVRRAGFKGHADDMIAQLENKDGVGVDLLYGLGDPEESARETATSARVFGVQVKVARPEFLLWMYLCSDQPRHAEDAAGIVRAGVDLKKVAAYLRHTRSDDELAKLGRIVARVRGSRDRRKA